MLLQAVTISTHPSDKQAQLPPPAAPDHGPDPEPNVHSQTDMPQSKRQKVEQPESMDSKPVTQPLQEARSVAAATKEQLGVAGKAS